MNAAAASALLEIACEPMPTVSSFFPVNPVSLGVIVTLKALSVVTFVSSEEEIAISYFEGSSEPQLILSLVIVF